MLTETEVETGSEEEIEEIEEGDIEALTEFLSDLDFMKSRCWSILESCRQKYETIEKYEKRVKERIQQLAVSPSLLSPSVSSSASPSSSSTSSSSDGVLKIDEEALNKMDFDGDTKPLIRNGLEHYKERTRLDREMDDYFAMAPKKEEKGKEKEEEEKEMVNTVPFNETGDITLIIDLDHLYVAEVIDDQIFEVVGWIKSSNDTVVLPLTLEQMEYLSEKRILYKS